MKKLNNKNNSILKMVKKIRVEILEQNEENMNPHYDPEMDRNGGGYYQPKITLKLRVRTPHKEFNRIFTIEDTSCGDFGNRWSIDVDNGLRLANHDNVDDIEWSMLSKMDKAILIKSGYGCYC